MLSAYFPQLLLGALVTIEVAICALIVGIVLGLIGALGEGSSNRFVRYLFIAFGTLFRGLPELLILFFVYYAGSLIFSQLTGRSYVEISPLLSGALALGLIFGAYASQVLRASFAAIHKGQRESALALGLSRLQIFYRITLPQAWRYALPGMSNLWLILLKDTSLVSLIGLTDLMSRTRLAVAATHQPFTFYLVCAGIYLLLTFVSDQLLKRWQQKINRPFK